MFESSGDVQSFVQGRLPPMSRQENYCNGRSPGQQDSKTQRAPRVTSFAGSDPVGRPVVKTR
jgi:hypothetical protein